MTQLPHRSSLAFALFGLLADCASLSVADTVSLTSSEMAPSGSDRIFTGGYRLDALAAPGAASEPFVLVAISGGGKTISLIRLRHRLRAATGVSCGISGRVAAATW